MCLARSKNDFAAIRKECEQLRLKYNAGLKDEEIAYRDQPDTQEVSALRKWANGSPDIKAERNKRLLVYAILLIIHMDLVHHIISLFIKLVLLILPNAIVYNL